MYILECEDKKYYTGSTKNLDRRIEEHQSGKGSNFTKKISGFRLVYYEEYDRIDDAFNREKQIQKWSHQKKQALICGNLKQLRKLSECQNKTHYHKQNNK